MAATSRIDTLKFAKSLTDAGLSREAAEAIAQGVAGADVSELATETDIAELRADIYNRLWVTGAGIVGLTVALMKLLPG
jgi:hypothetical protein